MAIASKTEKAPHLWVKDITEDDTITGHYSVKGKRLGKTRNGKPFLSITLGDRTGEVEAKVWEKAEALSSVFKEGDILEVQGNAESYRGQVQIKLSNLTPLKEEIDEHIFLESSARDISEMMTALRDVLKIVKNVHLRGLIDRFLADREFVLLFKTAPAAKNFHHDYIGGLLEHTLSVCQMATRVAVQYPHLDEELLLTAAFFHDIGKTRELNLKLNIDYTDEGRLIGHVVLAVTMVDEKLRHLKDFPRELAARLKHLILSHHGQLEFGSPKRPKFLEAFALNLIDDLDAKMNGLNRYMERDRREGAWTDFNRLFDRYLLKGEIQAIEKEPEGENEADEMQGSLFSS
jgi:3'-5' exoribonuclease